MKLVLVVLVVFYLATVQCVSKKQQKKCQKNLSFIEKSCTSKGRWSGTVACIALFKFQERIDVEVFGSGLWKFAKHSFEIIVTIGTEYWSCQLTEHI